jgi:hypothetical protein
MTKVNICFPDRSVGVDGVGLIIREEFWPADYVVGAHAIEWYGTEGIIEQVQTRGEAWKPHQPLTNEAVLQPYLDAHALEKATMEKEFQAKKHEVREQSQKPLTKEEFEAFRLAPRSF